jgi:hypothetical protein
MTVAVALVIFDRLVGVVCVAVAMHGSTSGLGGAAVRVSVTASPAVAVPVTPTAVPMSAGHDRESAANLVVQRQQSAACREQRRRLIMPIVVRGHLLRGWRVRVLVVTAIAVTMAALGTAVGVRIGKQRHSDNIDHNPSCRRCDEHDDLHSGSWQPCVRRDRRRLRTRVRERGCTWRQEPAGVQAGRQCRTLS